MLEAQGVNKATDQRPFPDVILKSQFFDTIGKRALTSEQRLMLAVLADAINLVQEGHRSISPRKRELILRGQELDFPVRRAMPALIRERLRCARDRCRCAAMAGRCPNLRQSRCDAGTAAAALERSEPRPTPDRQSSTSSRATPQSNSRGRRADLGLTRQHLRRTSRSLIAVARFSLFQTLLPIQFLTHKFLPIPQGRGRGYLMSETIDRPLSGIRVVELAMWVAGPSCSAVLGDWGADVIKLEDPNGGDPIRGAVTTRAMTDARGCRPTNWTTATSARSRSISAAPRASTSR